MPARFAGHFHVHDEYSPLDGSGNSNQIATEAARKGQTHLGRTNHGRLGGILEHVHACRHPELHDDPYDEAQKRSRDERLIPILGLEAFYRNDRFADIKSTFAYHLCLHARNLTGWHTLMRLSSKSWVRREKGGGFYGKPCIDLQMLKDDHEGIIVGTACVQSPVSQLIIAGDDSGAKRWCIDMIDVVGPDNFFFEVMPHDLDIQRMVNIGKINIANELGVPFKATGDVHAPYRKWCVSGGDTPRASTHSVLRMASYKTNLTKQERKEEAGEDVYTGEIGTVYLSSHDEFRQMFLDFQPDLPESIVDEALDNTTVFAHRFKMFTIGKATKLPRATESVVETERILREWMDEGRDRRQRDWEADGLTHPEIVQRHKLYDERRDYEFGVLKKKGVLDYFYLVADMVRWARSTAPLPGTKLKKRPIRVTCRGSAAGCLVSYDIGITPADPIQWGFLFERFLNPDRVGLPDIDLDFETDLPILMGMDGRELVKEYLRRKYGHDHVADIIAYQTFAPRAVAKEVGAVYELDYKQLDEFTESIGDTERDLRKIVKTNPIVEKFAEDLPEVWAHMLRLEDQILRDTKHAAGVLITPRPVNDYMPTQLGNDEETTVTAWSDRADFPVVSDYGFLKIDILGVRNLAKQQIAVDMIRDYYDEDVDLDALPVMRNPYATDPRVIDGFVKGMTLGVFQFGSAGITKLLRHMKPDNLIDITVANALYRPGPIKIAQQYGDRKNGKVPESEWYWHDAVEPLLKETYGLIAFQEQVMEIVKVLGNFTGGESDLMRKAISKLYRLPGDKAREFMEGWRQQWMDGCRDNGLDAKAATIIWEAILEFAGYGFNKSHSGMYSMQAYQDMHLKIFYPLCAYPAILTIEKKGKPAEQERFMKGVLREARTLGVDVLPPDVNRSRRGWSIDEKKIRFGFTAIKDMGAAAADDIIAERQEQPFNTYMDYLKRMPRDFSIKNGLALVKAGAFDSIDSREYLLSEVRKLAATKTKYKVTMSCGCKKDKTVDSEKISVEEAMEKLECKKHEGATVKEYVEQAPNMPVAQILKDKSIEPVDIVRTPTRDELNEIERETLKFPLSVQNTIAQYDDFIRDRVVTAAEFEETPAKPPRSKNKHGARCTCDDCAAAEVVVGGEIVNIKEIVTKGGDKMAFVEIALGADQFSVTIFNWLWLKVRSYISRPSAFLIAGHKDNKKQDSIIAYEVVDVVELAEAEGFKPAQAEKPKAKPKLKIKRSTNGSNKQLSLV